MIIMLTSEKYGTSIPVIICLFLAFFSIGCLNDQTLTKQEKTLHNDSLTKFAHPDRWKEDIRKFKEQDSNNPPAQNAVLFVGSSTIARWNTQKFFPDIETINRGFGGSYVVDSVYYADSIIIPYKPKTIVFYAGDNDTVDTKPPEMIFADFKALFIKIRTALPETRIIVISIKPSIERWKCWPQMQKTNYLISNYCKSQKNSYFVDLSAFMLDSNGRPRKDLLADGLHMNEKAYQLLTSKVRPLIDK